MSDEKISSRNPSPETMELPGIQRRRIKANSELQDHASLVQKTFSGRVSAVSGATPADDPGKTQSSQSAATTCDPISDLNSTKISEEVEPTRPVQPLVELDENGIATAVKMPSPQSTASDVTKTEYGQENAPILTGNGVIYVSPNNNSHNHIAVPSLPEAAKKPNSPAYSTASGITHNTAQRTNSNSTEETHAQSDEETNSHVTEETLARADETSHSDEIGNMIYRLFSKGITHAIENLLPHRHSHIFSRHVLEEFSKITNEVETLHIDRIRNKIDLLFSKKLTHAIENLFIRSMPLELQSDLHDMINQCKKIMFEDPYLNLKVFYCIAMQMYRHGKETVFCPLCLQRKEDRVNNKEESPHPNSHVFSRRVLEEFRKIHCEVELYEFIYNQISGEFKTSENLTWKLFCQKCETNASAEESLLVQVYLHIAGAKQNTVYMTEEDGLKVKHMLAVILFRTMLLGVNILEEYEDQFWTILCSLREFCSITNSAKYKSHSLLANFHVYVLANETYNKKNSNHFYPVDFQLRNPQLAQMVKIDNDKVFLHNKFDVFHCVLTIQWSDDVTRLDPKEHFHPFPEFLWKHYLSQIGSLSQYIYTLKSTCRAFLQDPLVQIVTSPPHSPLKLPPSVKISFISGDDPRSILDKDKIENLRRMARRKSPIAAMASQGDGYSDLEEKCKNLKSEKEKVQSHCAKAINKVKKFKQKLEESLKKLDARCNSRCNELEERIKKQEYRCNELEERIKKQECRCNELEERIKKQEITIDTLNQEIDYQKSYQDLHPYQSDNLDSV